MEKCAACGGAIGDSILFEWKNMPEGAQIIPQKAEAGAMQILWIGSTFGGTGLLL